MRIAVPLLVLLGTLGLSTPSSVAAKPAGYVPSDAERARWTMSDMRSLATALEAYAKDHHGYPAAGTFEALVPSLQPSYMRKAPSVDAWGNAFSYVPGAGGKSYRLVSGGSDGTTDASTWDLPGPLASFDDDAVLDSGSLTRPWPFR